MEMNLAILASGSGSNAEAIIRAVEDGTLQAKVCVVFSNVAEAKVLERAKNHNIPHVFLDHKLFKTREDFDLKMCEMLKKHGANTVAMAGYMRLVTPYFLQQFPNRVINIHPAILPSFPGVHGARDAVNYGVKFSGCSVHFVSEEMDAGPIIIQAIVPCHQEDSPQNLQDKIHVLEHRIYAQALQWLAQNRLEIKAHTVFLKPKSINEVSKDRATILGYENDLDKYIQGAMIYPPLEDGF